MITAKIDTRALTRSLNAAAKAFGETGAQAVTRWGVQTARELARQTQAFGVGSKPKQQQDAAIVSDALNVVTIVPNLPKKSNRNLTSAQDVNNWIEINRTRRRARTAKLPPEEKRFCTKEVFGQAMGIRKKRSGIAKGAWIGAGMKLSARGKQGKGGRINIGKNFLGYAHAHAERGDTKAPVKGWRNTAELLNRSAHSAQKTILTDARAKRAVQMSLKNTIKWYEKATEYELKKIKP